METPLIRVAVLSYPMLFQAQGGLQVQVRETISALNSSGCDARLVDLTREKLFDFDLVHVFSVINGNHRVVEWAQSHDKPVVLSPLLRPNWTSSFSRRAAFGDWMVGRLTGWEVKSEYRQMHSGITRASRCVALGAVEKACLVGAFGVAADSVDVVPNGIPQRFFNTGAEQFLTTQGVQAGYVLCVASINSHKNQLGLAAALADSGLRVVVIGHCQPADQPYLNALCAMPHVHYAGGFAHDSLMLASAYAGAGVFCIASMGEVMPLCVLEALAAGTPAVMTRHHAMDLDGLHDYIREIEPTSVTDIREAVSHFVSNPPSRPACARSVSALTWDAVAGALMKTYARASA